MKGSVTNFDLTEYEKDIAWLTGITQVRGVLLLWLRLLTLLLQLLLLVEVKCGAACCRVVLTWWCLHCCCLH